MISEVKNLINTLTTKVKLFEFLNIEIYEYSLSDLQRIKEIEPNNNDYKLLSTTPSLTLRLQTNPNIPPNSRRE